MDVSTAGRMRRLRVYGQRLVTHQVVIFELLIAPLDSARQPLLAREGGRGRSAVQAFAGVHYGYDWSPEVEAAAVAAADGRAKRDEAPQECNLRNGDVSRTCGCFCMHFNNNTHFSSAPKLEGPILRPLPTLQCTCYKSSLTARTSAPRVQASNGRGAPALAALAAPNCESMR